jgi:hypothetical protein
MRMEVHATSAVGFYCLLAFGITLIAAWVTHIVWIIGKLAGVGPTIGQVALGVIGAFMPPVGMIHGFMIWFGAGF